MSAAPAPAPRRNSESHRVSYGLLFAGMFLLCLGLAVAVVAPGPAARNPASAILAAGIAITLFGASPQSRSSFKWKAFYLAGPAAIFIGVLYFMARLYPPPPPSARLAVLKGDEVELGSGTSLQLVDVSSLPGVIVSTSASKTDRWHSRLQPYRADKKIGDFLAFTRPAGSYVDNTCDDGCRSSHQKQFVTHAIRSLPGLQPQGPCAADPFAHLTSEHGSQDCDLGPSNSADDRWLRLAARLMTGTGSKPPELDGTIATNLRRISEIPFAVVVLKRNGTRMPKLLAPGDHLGKEEAGAEYRIPVIANPERGTGTSEAIILERTGS